MNNKSYTFDIDDWEIVYDNNKDNQLIETQFIETQFIETQLIETQFIENWYNDINNTLLKLKLENKEVWEDKNIKDIIKDAKKSWNEKLNNQNKNENEFYQNKYTKKRKIS